MGKTAFVFPGQGAQHVGMACDIAEKHPAADKIFEEADRVLGYGLYDIIKNGPEDKLMETRTTQPAILTAEWAICSVLLETAALPDCTAGLSLGEYTGHVLAGSLGFKEAVALVEKRGTFMQEAVPLGKGGMTAVIGLDEDTVEEVCKEVSDVGYVACANYNCPGQIVISGELPALEKAGGLLQERGAKRVIPLSVSAPFHCKMLKGAGDKLAAELQKIEIGEMKIPVYANVTGEVVASKEDIKDLLTRQVSETVKWTNTVRNMMDAGVDTFYEIGPGKVLSGLIRKTDRAAKVINVSDVQSLDEAMEMLKRG